MSCGHTPYKDQPTTAFWSSSVARVPAGQVEPTASFPFKIDRSTRIATAGSCFAQHIARYLSNSGFCYLVTERAHPMIPKVVAEKHQYGLFSARYGNIYTTRQLLQLFKRAQGSFLPDESIWVGPNGGFVDPFRPTVQTFHSRAELLADQSRHLEAVRGLFESLDVFVFTLGLTECWVSRSDGAAFPVCPGVSGGSFDGTQHAFLNLGVDDVVGDLQEFLGLLRTVNPSARLILTVSPVPLAATAGSDHVMSATCYSKAVLRVAAHRSCTEMPNVGYFPAFEIITGQHARGRYYAKNLRDVEPEGVKHVMRVFFKHVAGEDLAAAQPTHLEDAAATSEPTNNSGEIAELICEENLLDLER